jgi:hypothetical protein
VYDRRFKSPPLEQFLDEVEKRFLLYASGFCCYKRARTMFWRIVVWLAIVEVLLCLVPFELTGIISLLHLWHIGG